MSRVYLAAFLIIGAPTFALADDVAFRITELELRDPHAFTEIVVCVDLTSQLNATLQENIQTDGDGDGFLDLSILLVFRPLDQAGVGGDLDLGLADCVPPSGATSCAADPGNPLTPTTYANDTGDPCLVPNPEWIRPYSPPIVEPTAPCFVTEATDITVVIGGVGLPLQSGRVAATYVGNPATTLIQGILEGFLSEEVADGVSFPPDIPFVGGLPVSAIFPGGTGNCSPDDDRDLGPDGVTVGWWLYLNFEAEAVPFENPVAVEPVAPAVPFRVAAHPNPFAAVTVLQLDLQRGASLSLRIFDSAGRVVRTLHRGPVEAGHHAMPWDGHDDGGVRVGAGVYLYRLEGTSGHVTGKLLLTP